MYINCVDHFSLLFTCDSWPMVGAFVSTLTRVINVDNCSASIVALDRTEQPSDAIKRKLDNFNAPNGQKTYFAGSGPKPKSYCDCI